MLARIFSESGMAISSPNPGSYLPESNAKQSDQSTASHSGPVRDGVFLDSSRVYKAPQRLYTPSYSSSPENESFESLETSAAKDTQFPLRHEGVVRRESSVPRAQFSGGSATTLMLKNIPNRVTREDLVDEILTKMPAGSFDFMYLPVDFASKAGFGYAFVNCTSEEAVELFISTFHKRRLACAGGVYSKPLEVTIARVQGFTANVNRLISSPVLFQAEEGSLPLIFNRNQVSIPFKSLMQLNRASMLFQNRPSIEDLIAMVEAEMTLDH
jgi:hypothetical protein